MPMLFLSQAMETVDSATRVAFGDGPPVSAGAASLAVPGAGAAAATIYSELQDRATTLKDAEYRIAVALWRDDIPKAIHEAANASAITLTVPTYVDLNDVPRIETKARVFDAGYPEHEPQEIRVYILGQSAEAQPNPRARRRLPSVLP